MNRAAPSAVLLGIEGYDAFISYSRHEDGWLAPALQSGLERFAKPWYRVRGVRIFRDKASLAASPELWGSIETALRDSRWFVLLASPEAARSPWVDREVAWWLANKSADRILVVATSDRLRWDKRAGDWAADAPVPPSLRGAFRTEPLWADLTGVRAGRRGVRVPDEDLATVAAPLRGVARDTLIGEHLRQHRRTMRVVRSVLATLTALLVVSVAASVIAVGQRDEARTEARIATARELAALSGSMLGTNLRVARLLAVAGYQADRDPQTEAAVFQAATASPPLVRYLQAGSPVSVLAGSADGTTIVAGTTGGDLVAFDLTTGRRATVHATSGAVRELAVSADGHTVAAMDGSQAVTWTPGAPRATRVAGVRQPTDVAVSPSGEMIAVLEGYGNLAVPETLVVRAADGRERTVPVTPIPGTNPGADFDSVGFPSGSSLVLVSSVGQWRRLDATSLRPTAESDSGKAPGDEYQAGSAENGAYAGYEKEGHITVWPTSGTGQPGSFLHGTVPGATSAFFTIRPDGQEAAIAESSTIALVPLSTSGTASPVRLTGSGDTKLIAFLGNGGELASAANSTISVWNPERQGSRLSAPTRYEIPFDNQSAPPPVLLTSPAGAWTDLVGGGWTGAWLFTPRLVEEQAAKQVPGLPAGVGGWDLPIRSGNTPLLIGMVTSPTSDRLFLGRADGTVVKALPAPPVDRAPGQTPGDATPPDPAGAAMLPGGKQFVLVGTDGSVLVYDIQSGRFRQVVRAKVTSSGPSTTVYPFNVSVSPDGSAVAIGEWENAPDGDVISLGVRYVDLRTGRSHMVGGGAADGDLFTSDGLLVQRDSGTVEVWNRTGQRLLRTMPGTGAVTPAIAVSPDGTLLARLGDNGTVSVTDLASGDVLGTIGLPEPATPSADPWMSTDIAFTADGTLLTATTGGQLIRWTVDPPDLVRTICATTGGTLTAAQWRQYAGTSPPAAMPCAS